MRWVDYRKRKAIEIENADIVVTILEEGGHIASIVRTSGATTGINPLWTPPWSAIEPSVYQEAPQRFPEYGTTHEAPILASIMGHSICLDTYGAPSEEEALAGIPIHGEGPLMIYDIVEIGEREIRCSALLPLAQLIFTRTLRLDETGHTVHIFETIENLSACDRPIAWTQHITLGPPFIEHGRTECYVTATRSQVIDTDFGGVLEPGAEFNWPLCPDTSGGNQNLSIYPSSAVSGEFTTHLADTTLKQSAFAAFSPTHSLVFGYAWNRQEFPWICRWEENHARSDAPWNNRTVALAIEFGVSPVIESRRAMVERGSQWGQSTFRWVPAKTRIDATYCAFLINADRLPTTVEWQQNLGATLRFN